MINNTLSIKRYTAVIIILLLLPFTLLHANFRDYFPVSLSDKAYVSFIACEPGDEVYTVFGHAAIRIKDSQNGIDHCYHWGIFDYNTTDFIYRFVKGETDYEMGIYPTHLFMSEYIYRQSTVYEAIINLTPEEKQHIYENLLTNYEPQNRKYRYNYVFDNCSTRPVNLILSSFNRPTCYDTKRKESTFRDIISMYTKKGSLLCIGIDIIVGSHADKNITDYESTAFPLLALEYLQHSKLDSSTTAPFLILRDNTIYRGIDRLTQTKSPMRHLYCSLCILITILILIHYHKTRTIPKITFTVFLTISTLFGLLITFLTFFSEHPLVGYNYNALWLNPMHFLLIIAIFMKPNKYTSYTSLFFLITTAAAGIIYLLGIQHPCSPIICLWTVYLAISATIFLQSKQIATPHQNEY